MISIAISSLRRAAVTPARNMVAQRHLSVARRQTVRKLSEVLEEYRAENYSRESPKRFQKDVVRAAAVNSSCRVDIQMVSAEGIERLLRNIGMENRMSLSEIEGLMSEVGTSYISDDGQRNYLISANQMLDLISWQGHYE